MGKYYYVIVANATAYRTDLNCYKKTETGKLLDNIVKDISLGYSEPSATALLSIKKCAKQKKEKGFLGISYTDTYFEYEPFFIICEKKDEYLEEVITGRKYEMPKERCYNTYNNTNNKSEKLKLSTIREIPSSKVVEMLQSLKSDDISRFKLAMDRLEQAIYNGYQKDIIRENEEVKQQQDNDAYIKNFRNKYGK